VLSDLSHREDLLQRATKCVGLQAQGATGVCAVVVVPGADLNAIRDSPDARSFPEIDTPQSEQPADRLFRAWRPSAFADGAIMISLLDNGYQYL
jgi:hypothetical protein